MQNFADAILHGDKLIAPGTDGIFELTLSNAALTFDGCYIGENVTVKGSEVGGFVGYGGTCVVKVTNC